MTSNLKGDQNRPLKKTKFVSLRQEVRVREVRNDSYRHHSDRLTMDNPFTPFQICESLCVWIHIRFLCFLTSIGPLRRSRSNLIFGQVSVCFLFIEKERKKERKIQEEKMPWRRRRRRYSILVLQSKRIDTRLVWKWVILCFRFPTYNNSNNNDEQERNRQNNRK